MTRPFRRRVLYIPGYDPIPPRRYRELYRREGEEQARISGYRLDFGPRGDRTGFGWGVTGHFPEGTAQADIEVLVWADVVQGSMGRSIPATYGQLVRTAWTYVASGALFRLMRLRRAPVIAALYPIVVLLAELALALAIGGAVWSMGARLVHWLPGLVLGLGAAAAILWWFRRIDGRVFAYYLIARHGIERRVHTAGTAKSWLDPFRPERPEDVARLHRLLEPIHEAFKAQVRARRGDRLDPARDYFTGDVWVGREAVSLGLADGIGHLEPVMRDLFGDKVRFQTYGQRVPFLRRFGISADDFIDAAAERAAFARLTPGG